MIKKKVITKEEIIDYYEHRKKQRGSNREMEAYCIENGLNYTTYKNTLYTIERNLEKNHEVKQLVHHAKNYLRDNCLLSVSQYSRKYNLEKNQLSAIIRSIQYKKIIEDYESNQKKGYFTFIKLNQKPRPPFKIDPEPQLFNDDLRENDEATHAQQIAPMVHQKPMESDLTKKETSAYQQQEVIPSQNAIELIVQKGIKVSVDPEVSPEKILKIIQLLKEL